jgi:carbon-monoxide dehydrogenase medium subunit
LDGHYRFVGIDAEVGHVKEWRANRRRETEMQAFELLRATSAQQAIEFLAAHGPAVKTLAGGTDLMADYKSDTHGIKALVDISLAEDLKGIALTDEGLRIGSLVTHSEIMASPLIRDMFPALVDAAHSIGAVQTRNLGTLGGNLMTCIPSMDSGPVLVALDATVTIAGPEGSRKIPLSDMFVGPRKTALRFDELLVEIVIPKRNVGKPTAFLKFGLRKGQALALVNVAASFWVDEKTNSFRDPAIALGAVAPKVIRAPNAEKYLAGRAISEEAMAEAGRIAVGEAKPISDFRASADYRRELVSVLTRRALANAFELHTSKQRDKKP